MHLPPQEAIEQLQFELNDTKGRLDALSFMARIILDSVKLQDEEDFLHEGEINFVDNELDLDTGTKQVRAVFKNEEHMLEPGLFGRLKITTTKPFPALVIPDQIIATEQTRKYVYIVNDENKAQRTYLKLGDLTEDKMRIVKSGLSREAQIITSNLQMIQPNMPVSVIRK